MAALRFNYRAYPDKGQAKRARRLFGCCRVAFNDAIREARAARARGESYPGGTVLQKRVLTEGKRRPDRGFLNEACGVALIQAVRDADVAYRNFFASASGKRAGRRLGAPRLRSRRDRRQTARFTKATRFRVTDRGDGWASVRLSGIGDVRFRLSRLLPEDPSSVTLIRDADGRWHVSFVVEACAPVSALAPRRACGVDVGLKDFAAIVSVDLTTGREAVEKIKTPLFLRRRLKALQRSQRVLARRQKGSANREKARLRVAAEHRKVRDARADHAHQLAARLVDTHDVVIVEDYAAAAAARNRRLARSAHDQGLGQFLALTEHHAVKRGKAHHRIDRWHPSTQRCSACGERTGPSGIAALGVRTWGCPCGAIHDRDTNAGRNILLRGLQDLGLEPTTQDTHGLWGSAYGLALRRSEVSSARRNEVGRNAGAVTT